MNRLLIPNRIEVGRNRLDIKPNTAITGLDWTVIDNTAEAGDTIQFRFSGANLIPAFPATYIWRVRPSQQTGFYTTFFHVSSNTPFHAAGYYGFHPYPQGDPGSSGTVHNWEISVNGQDDIDDENANSTVVTKEQWYIQAATVEEIASDELDIKFYWNLPDENKLIRYDSTGSDYATGFPPPNNVLVVGDAPWSPGNETMCSIFRGFQQYSGIPPSIASLKELAANHTSNTPANAWGQANVWYMNQSPTPSDISDKSGAGHNPEWFGSNRPDLWEE